MSTTGNPRLAMAIIALPIATTNLQHPEEIKLLFDAINRSIFGPYKPRVALNRRFAKLRQARPKIFFTMNRWLHRPDVKERISSTGTYWAWRSWRIACIKMHRGEKAHTAFGMGVPGQQKTFSFKKHEDAALLAEYFSRCQSVNSDQATILACQHVGVSSKRDVERRRAELRTMELPTATLVEQAEHIQMKYDRN